MENMNNPVDLKGKFRHMYITENLQNALIKRYCY